MTSEGEREEGREGDGGKLKGSERLFNGPAPIAKSRATQDGPWLPTET